MSSSEARLHATALDALGDPTRRAVLEIVARGPCPVQEIADRLPVSRPAVSRHLRLLKAAELVQDEAIGSQRIYRLRPEGLDAVRRYFEQLWGDAADRFRLAAENTAAENTAAENTAAENRATESRATEEESQPW